MNFGRSITRFDQQGETDAPTKPRFRDPCNGRGVCCALEVCRVGLAAGFSEGPCPALIFEAGRFWCGLVVLEKEKGDRPLLAKTLAIGRGCDSQMEGEKD